MSKLRILLSGMIAADPQQGGATWAVLQYVLGLHALGHDVCLLEPVARDHLRPAGTTLGDSVNARYFIDVARRFGLEGDAALMAVESDEIVGLDRDAVRTRAASADLLINISGLLRDDALIARVPVRVYLDLDPAFNQMWEAFDGIDMGFGGHTHFVTVGWNVGRAGSVVPDCGREWIPTWQPVVLERWPVAERLGRDALTTVGNWRGYGSIERNGVLYGQKAHSLRPFFALPSRTRERFELALAIHPDETLDLAGLRENGWGLVDPAEVAGTPDDYQAFVQDSKGEFGIAKSGYVRSRCGWFSDRSVCYLASGRPVIAQETGFSDVLPVGDGLFAFETMDDVLAAIECLRTDYPRHRAAARDLAEEYFESTKVLSRLIDRVGATS